MRFDAGYREPAVLRDGSQVVLRTVRPEDRELLRRGFERLSPESRYRRFLSAKTHLSEAELDYLTRLDGQDHFALGATTAGGEEGVGIARFIRSTADPRVAEVAVAVVDDWQRKGLGTLLLIRLVAAARERGIEAFAGHALASNPAIREVLAQLEGVGVTPYDGELGVQVPLPEVPMHAEPTPEEREAPLRRLWLMVARGILLARNAMQRLS